MQRYHLNSSIRNEDIIEFKPWPTRYCKYIQNNVVGTMLYSQKERNHANFLHAMNCSLIALSCWSSQVMWLLYMYMTGATCDSPWFLPINFHNSLSLMVWLWEKMASTVYNNGSKWSVCSGLWLLHVCAISNYALRYSLTTGSPYRHYAGRKKTWYELNV